MRRDIYYKHPALFGSQLVVDRIVDDIAYSFDVTRATLNVVDDRKRSPRPLPTIIDTVSDCGCQRIGRWTNYRLSSRHDHS